MLKYLLTTTIMVLNLGLVASSRPNSRHHTCNTSVLYKRTINQDKVTILESNTPLRVGVSYVKRTRVHSPNGISGYLNHNDICTSKQ